MFNMLSTKKLAIMNKNHMRKIAKNVQEKYMYNNISELQSYVSMQNILYYINNNRLIFRKIDFCKIIYYLNWKLFS